MPAGYAHTKGVRALETLEAVKGRVGRVLYRSADGEYVVARFQPEKGEATTIVGPLYGIEPDDVLVVWGETHKHPRFGPQVKVVRWEKPVPTGRDQVIEFLASPLIKGVGKSRAKAIVKVLGDDAIQRILDGGPEVLLQVKGIGQAQAAQIHESLAAHLEAQQVVMGLLPFGLSTRVAVKAYKLWGRAALDIIKDNPYRLMDLSQIGFHKADALATRMGIHPTSPYRIQAASLHVLNEATSSGHCYLPCAELVKMTMELLNTPELTTGMVNSAIMLLVAHSRLAQECERVYLKWLYDAEKLLASKVGQFATRNTASLQRVRQYIQEYEEMFGLKLAGEQAKAVEQLFQHGLLILTGGPGTGKTATVKAVLDVFQRLRPNARIALASPTGRASQNLAEVTGMEASTIHRLLGFQPGGETEYDAFHPLPHDLLVVDEASMLDLPLAAALFDALDPRQTTVLLLGDVDQLPSVGPGNVLRDLIEAGIPTVRLTHIFRQAQESQIVVNAHRVLRGQRVVADHSKGDFYFLRYEEPAVIAQVIQASVKKMLAAGYTPQDIQVLSPMKKSELGTQALNVLLQETVNPPAAGKPEVTFGKTVFRVGDKVIQLKNSYEKEVFNGDIGVIEEIRRDAEEVSVVVRIRDARVEYAREELEELALAYAITVHKSQGGEYPVVIMPVSTSHYIMLARNLIYTAITRAKQKMVLVGTDKALGIAVRNDKLAARNTTLKERILYSRSQKSA